MTVVLICKWLGIKSCCYLITFYLINHPGDFPKWMLVCVFTNDTQSRGVFVWSYQFAPHGCSHTTIHMCV